RVPGSPSQCADVTPATNGHVQLFENFRFCSGKSLSLPSRRPASARDCGSLRQAWNEKRRLSGQPCAFPSFHFPAVEESIPGGRDPGESRVPPPKPRLKVR